MLLFRFGLLKKTGHLFLTIFLLSINSSHAQVFLSEDFNSAGIPSLPTGWISAPGALWLSGMPNGTTPNALGSLNFSLNDTAHMKAIGIDGSQAVADGAMLCSPSISLPSSATNAALKFDVAYFGFQSSTSPPQTESLVFTVSMDNGITWSDVAFITPVNNPSNNVWETRSIAMGGYAGQANLKFGFRYNNQGGNLIGAVLDNVKLINGADGSIIRASAGDHPDPSTETGYQLSGSNTTLKGTVQNTGTVAINNYYIKYQIAGDTIQSSPLISTTLLPMDTAAFPQALNVVIPANSTYTIKSWIEVVGDMDHKNDTVGIMTVGVPYLPVKRPVFEEGTGTWCGWCPRGAVFMDQFASDHPNGDAAQIAVHNNDPMMVLAYDSCMADYARGFPNIVIDRTFIKDPREIDTLFSEVKKNFGFADITLDSPLINGNTVSVPVTIQPVVDIPDPRMTLIITESNVTGTGANWPQNNYYSGGGSGTMGGWENEAPYVSDVYFHFVARSISPSARGSKGNLPATLIAGMVYKDTLAGVLDNNTWKANDLQYIVLLLNGSNGSVMNSAFTALPILSPALSHSTAINEKEIINQQCILYPNPSSGMSYLMLNSQDVDKALITISDITGKKLLNLNKELLAGNNVIKLNTQSLAAGTYLVNLITGKDVITLRLQILSN